MNAFDSDILTEILTVAPAKAETIRKLQFLAASLSHFHGDGG